MQLSITQDVIRSMVAGKVFKDNNARINSICYHRTEDLLVTASDDDTVQVIDTAAGVKKGSTPSKKYGCCCVTWTHSPYSVVYASNKGQDHAVRYLNLTTQSYEHYFRGHTDKVTNVSMSPRADTVMTSSQDKTVRLWDLRTPVCQAVLQLPGQPLATFDQQGLVFAVATDSGIIKLYDVNQYSAGPFDAFVVEEMRNSPLPFSHLSFSNDGNSLLAVAESKVFVLNAFNGAVVRKFSNGTPEGGTPPEAAISYDAQYVMAGCEDRSVRVWSVATGAQLACWNQHAAVPSCCKWAPRRLSAATACGALCLWIPSAAIIEAQIKQQQQQQQQQVAAPGQQYYVAPQPAAGYQPAAG